MSEFLERHPRVAAGLGLVLVGGLVVLDVTRLRQAARVMAESFWPAVAIGLAGAVLTLAFVVQAARRARGRSPRRWRPWVVWGVLVLVGFLATHPRGDHPVRGIWQVTVVAYLVGLLCAAVIALVLGVVRGRLREAPVERRTHDDRDLVEVWRVDDSSGRTPEYLVARCSCGWIGQAIDVSRPDAVADAFTEARSHGRRVHPTVTAPLG